MQTPFKILLSLVILAFAGLGLYSMSWFQLKQVQLPAEAQGSVAFSKARQVLNSYKGKNLMLLSLFDLRQHLLDEGFPLHFVLRKRYPNTLELSIQDVEPILWYFPQKGSLKALALGGQVVLSKEPKGAAIFTGKAKQSVRKAAVEFWVALPKQGAFSQKSLSEISYNEARDSFQVLVLYREQLLEVSLGSVLSLKKIARVGAILGYLSKIEVLPHKIEAQKENFIRVFRT